MKAWHRHTLLSLLAVASAPTVASQIKWGPRVGVCLDRNIYNAATLTHELHTGFTGGVAVELMIPVINIGVDASAMYAERTTIYTQNTFIWERKRCYIDCPVTAKWKFSIPGVGTFLSPFIIGGADFSTIISGRQLSSLVNDRRVDLGLTAGIGVELLGHLQFNATYGRNITTTASGRDALYEGNNRGWCVTTTLFF